MTQNRKILIFSALLISLFIFRAPITALAKVIHTHMQSLQGNWGSSGVMDAPRIGFSPQDQPKYICQWQIYTQEKHIDSDGKEHQKINWTWFEFDQNQTHFDSKNLNWNVAYVYSRPLDQIEPLKPEEKVLSLSGERSAIDGLLRQSVYISYQPKKDSYQIKPTIFLQQEVDGLIISDSTGSSHFREQIVFENHSSIQANRKNGPPLYTLNSSLHCTKLN